MITAYEAKKYAEMAHLSRLAALEESSANWIEANVANKIEEAAKSGYSFVTVLTTGARQSMKTYITSILQEGGYRCDWHKFESVTIRWN